MTLGDYIRAYRREAKLSQREFAKKCDLSNGYISMLERGINPKTNEPITPSLVQLKKLADGMCVTVNDILLEVDDMPVDVGVSAKDQPTVSDGLFLDGITDTQRFIISAVLNMSEDRLQALAKLLGPSE